MINEMQLEKIFLMGFFYNLDFSQFFLQNSHLHDSALNHSNKIARVDNFR